MCFKNGSGGDPAKQARGIRLAYLVGKRTMGNDEQRAQAGDQLSVFRQEFRDRHGGMTAKQIMDQRRSIFTRSQG